MKPLRGIWLRFYDPFRPNIKRIHSGDHKAAIQNAVRNPTDIDMNRVNASRRAYLDRLVGYQVSPLLWEKVQESCPPDGATVALRIICEREEEIEHSPETYFTTVARS